MGHLVLGRILLAQDRRGPALALLGRLHAAAQDRADGLIEAGALLALARAATGDEAGAVTALAGALLLACPQGYIRVFADEGPPMAALLGRLIAAQRTGQAAAEVPLGYLARLQRAFGSGQQARDPVPSGIVDPLTSRARGLGEASRGPVESGHRPRTGGHPGHGQKACGPRPG